MNGSRLLSVLIFGLVLCLTPSLAGAQQIPQSTGQMQLTFAPLVKKTSPAVVNIYAKVKVRQRVITPFFNDPFFNQFFGGTPGIGGVQERIENALGSGVIVGEKGLIATNTHVIANATEIVAVTADGREFPVDKILEDPKTDLAILKVKNSGDDLPWLTLADSDAVEVGDLVLAIGNPFGVGQTVTTGIVSGLARTGVGASDYSSFIQTDAAINPGNSGGALIDMQGRVIGINSMIFSKDGGSLGIGFAIPANMVKTVIEASKTGNKIVRPWSGVTGQPVTADMVDSLKLKRVGGVLLNTVDPRGPAAKAGLKPGDVILAIDGKTIQGPQELRFRLATVGIGHDVTLGISRMGVLSDVKMTTEAPPEVPPRDETLIKGVNPLAGAVVVNISPAVVEMIGTIEKDSGVVVLRSEGGPAARIGLQAGDIILSVNGTAATSVKQLVKLLGEAKQRWIIRLQRGHEILSMTVNGG